MRTNHKAAALTILLLTVTVAASAHQVAAQTYVIQLQGLTWDHLTLKILITPRPNQQWWREYYLNATLRAVARWNGALQNFSGYDTQFSILASVQLVPTVGSLADGYDIYLTWQEELTGGETIGSSQAIYRQPCLMVNNTILLASRIPQGATLNDIDSFNAATHELGHALGLSHTQTQADVMYPRLTIGGPAVPVSTLDAYGVWQVMRWLDGNPLTRRPTCPQAASLPSSISYEYLSPTGNLPMVNQPWISILQAAQPILAYVILFAGAVVVSVAIIRWTRSRRTWENLGEPAAGG